MTQDSFEAQVLNSPRPTVVMATASWCNACRSMAPIFDDVAGGPFANVANFVTIELPDNPDIASRYGLRVLPAFLIVKNGQIVATRDGFTSKPAFMEWIDSSAR